MNAKRFRLVFNRARGMRVAVAETAGGHGRGRSAALAPMPLAPAAASSVPRFLPWFAARASAFAALCAWGLQPLLVQAQATLPLTPDRNAPGAHPVVGVAGNVDRYNRQLHPEERESIERRKANYAKQNGFTTAQAEQELLAQANLMVQNGSPGQWNERAAAFLRQERGMLPADGNSGPGYMFYAIPDQKANPNMYAGYYPNGLGMNVPNSQDIANSVARDAASRESVGKQTWAAAALAGGFLSTAAAGSQLAVAASGTANFGVDALAAYKAAQAGYSLSTAAITGGAVSGSVFTASALAGAGLDSKRNGTDFGTNFDNRFSTTGLGAATTVGALNGMFGASMFSWAAIPNSISNVFTVPGAVIRINSIVLSQTVGRAAHEAVKQPNDYKKIGDNNDR